MAFTNHGGLFAAVHENGINATIGHLMRQRPSLPGRGEPYSPARPTLVRAGDHGFDPSAAHILAGQSIVFLAETPAAFSSSRRRLSSRTPRCARGRSGSR